MIEVYAWVRSREKVVSCGRVSDLLVHDTSVLALSAHVSNEEDDSKHEAQSTDNDVANGEEEVLTTENIGS